LNDLGYVFGAATTKTNKKTGEVTRSQKLEVKDPSVGQLVDRGYFRMAGEDATASEKSSRISKAFATEMVQQGFEMGAAWGSSDAMHFEIAVGATPAAAVAATAAKASNTK
jgi:hypothetical protein